jgi:valyl-tRNA synthetase
MGWVIRLISEIRSVRSDMNVPAGAKIRLLVKDAADTTKRRLETYDEIIRRMARLETIELTAAAPKGALQTVVDEATVILPIADIIDLDKERERLKKQILKLEDDIRKIDQKLENQDFVANAPAEIIEEQKQRRSDCQNTMQKLSQALRHLEAA